MGFGYRESLGSNRPAAGTGSATGYKDAGGNLNNGFGMRGTGGEVSQKSRINGPDQAEIMRRIAAEKEKSQKAFEQRTREQKQWEQKQFEQKQQDEQRMFEERLRQE